MIVTKATDFFSGLIKQNFDDQVYGGRPHEISNTLDHFFETFRNLGVEFVFVARDSNYVPPVERRFTIFDELSKRISDVMAFIDRFERIPDPASINYRYREFLAFSTTDTCLEYGTFTEAQGDTGPHAMVQYARNHENVVAILAFANEFLMHNLNNTPYWRCDEQTLDFKIFTTKCYDFEMIHRYLNVSDHQYYVMAAVLMIVGTNKGIWLRGGHRNHNGGTANGTMSQKRIRRVLELVKQHCPREFDADFKSVAQLVFEDGSGEYGDQLETQYNRLVHLKENNYVQNFTPYSSLAYQLRLLNNTPICANTEMEYLQFGNQTYADLLVTLNQKAMGLLLKDEIDASRQILFKRDREESLAEITIEPESPTCNKIMLCDAIYITILFTSNFFLFYSYHSSFGGALRRGGRVHHANEMENFLLDSEFGSIICLHGTGANGSATHSPHGDHRSVPRSCKYQKPILIYSIAGNRIIPI